MTRGMARAPAADMQSLLSDVLFAIRLLGRPRGFAIVGGVVLGLGIGVKPRSSAQSINAVILTPLPFEDPDRIIRLHQSLPERGWRNAIPRRTRTGPWPYAR